jgi:hypothetical protein
MATPNLNPNGTLFQINGNGSSGGIGTLQWPNTASAYTWTLPLYTGTLLVNTGYQIPALVTNGGVQTIVLPNSASSYTYTFPAATGTVLLNVSGAFSVSVAAGGTHTVQFPATASSYTYTFPAVSGTNLNTGSATNSFTPSNPAATTSATAVMMGLGSTIAFTPNQSTRLLIIISGQMGNTVAGDVVTAQLRYGTGTAPANGVAVTGTQIAGSQTITSVSAGQRSGLCLTCILPGLSIGTAYWFDLALNITTGGSGSVTGVNCSIAEI